MESTLLGLSWLCESFLTWLGFLLALLPAGLTLYLTDVWITSGTHMPTSWILGIIVCVFLIHFYQFYFVNYNSQMNADRMAGNYRQHLAQKILSSSIPAYESQNKARIQNMANDVSAIYTVSSYLVTVPANLVKVIIIIGLLLFYASPSVALTAIILIPLYMVPSFLNKSELERLVAKEREAGDLWFQEFDVILNGKVSITLNKVENYMQNRYNEALKSYLDARNRQHFLLLIVQEFPLFCHHIGTSAYFNHWRKPSGVAKHDHRSVVILYSDNCLPVQSSVRDFSTSCPDYQPEAILRSCGRLSCHARSAKEYRNCSPSKNRGS